MDATTILVLLALLCLSSPITVLASDTNNNMIDACESLDCLNGAICRQGDADYTHHPLQDDGTPLKFHQETSRNGYFCDCPLGLTGIRCSRPFTTCGLTGNVCYHGGTCITSGNEDIDEELMFCNCTLASFNGNAYVGKYCETPVNGVDKDSNGLAVVSNANNDGRPSLDICNERYSLFCINGGTCKFRTNDQSSSSNTEFLSMLEDHGELYNQETSSWCDCPTEKFHGPHCEFQIDDPLPKCNLDCQNGGTCRIGIVSYDDLQDYQHYYSTYLEESHSTCVCPSGWYGRTCEIPNNIVDACDETSNMFCVNGGTCEKETNTCTCPDEFDGPHCEFPQGQVPDCHLECQNGGVCQPGMEYFEPQITNYSEYWIQKGKFTYCACPKGYHGVYCDISTNQSNTHICNMVAEETEKEDNSKDVDTQFCINGGTCKGQEENTYQEYDTGIEAILLNQGGVDDYCLCPDEYRGIHCEYLKNQVPECTLNCQNGGVCQVGSKPVGDDVYSYIYFDARINFQYCSCPPDYYGIECEISSVQCDQVDSRIIPRCFNGGRCVYNEDEDDDGTSTQTFSHCDCAYNNRSGTATPFTNYAGTFCQYPSTTICDLSPYYSYFCVNGGSCSGSKNNDNGAVEVGCNCPDGFSGPICEYSNEYDLGIPPTIDIENTEETNTKKNGTTATTATTAPITTTATTSNNVQTECQELQCQNGGRCRVGANYDTATPNTTSPELAALMAKNKDKDSKEHCICPEGYSGLQCEIPVEVCYDQDHSLATEHQADVWQNENLHHVCLHGSKCIQEGDESFSCQCETAWTPSTRYAGPFCQHHHTDICTIPAKENLQYGGSGSNLVGIFGEGGHASDAAFCVNDGVCRAYVYKDQEHEGCDCPDGYNGPHCEYFVGDESSYQHHENYNNNNDNDGIGILIFYIFVLGILSIILLCFTIRLRNIRKIQQQNPNYHHQMAMNRNINAYRDNVDDDAVAADAGSLMDPHGNVIEGMEEVELL